MLINVMLIKKNMYSIIMTEVEKSIINVIIILITIILITIQFTAGCDRALTL